MLNILIAYIIPIRLLRTDLFLLIMSRVNDEKHNVRYDTSGELPLITITKKKALAEYETETFDIAVRSYHIQECLDTLEKVKVLFDIDN